MRENIIQDIFYLIEEYGYLELDGEFVSNKLNISIDEIYQEVGDRTSIKKALIPLAEKAYDKFQKEYVSSKGSSYLNYGMAYVLFAKEHKRLFELIFMRERDDEEQRKDGGTLFSEPLSALMSFIKIDYFEAKKLNIDMWLYAHGIATIIANNYIKLDDSIIEEMLIKAFVAFARNYGFEQGRDY